MYVRQDENKLSLPCKLLQCVRSSEQQFIQCLLFHSTCVLMCLFSGVRKTTAKGETIMYDLEKKINEAVFPGLQGGPHDNVIAGLNHFWHSVVFCT